MTVIIGDRTARGPPNWVCLVAILPEIKRKNKDATKTGIHDPTAIGRGRIALVSKNLSEFHLKHHTAQRLCNSVLYPFTFTQPFLQRMVDIGDLLEDSHIR